MVGESDLSGGWFAEKCWGCCMRRGGGGAESGLSKKVLIL